MAGELKNIYYINFVPENSRRYGDSQAKLEAFKQNVELNSQFMNAKANCSVKDQIASGQLKNEMVAKAAYKARVINHLVSNSPWMVITHVMNESKHFDTDKSRFHQELGSTFTEGLNLPSSITSDVEGVLAEIKQAITTANQSGNEANKLQFIIVLNVLKFDEMIGSWQSDVCAIYFRLDNSLSAYIRNKDETTKVTVSILYSHFNAQFGDRMFETKVKDSIQKFISDSGRVEGLSVDVSFDNGEYFRDKGW